MQIFGAPIRDHIQAELAPHFLERPHTLTLVVVGEDSVTRRFVEVKKKFAAQVHCEVREVIFPEDVTTEALIASVQELALDQRITGIVVQLPLPPHVDVSRVLNTIPMIKDVDMLSDEAMSAFVRGETVLLPPVLGAAAEILKTYEITPHGKRVLVLGSGRLVGAPVARWFEREGAEVEVVDRAVSDLGTYTHRADIIVSGVGIPGLVKASMVLPHHILIDAGTSESSGKLEGDIDRGAYDSARLVTPVPGGVGPLTVAILFRNLALLGALQAKNKL